LKESEMQKAKTRTPLSKVVLAVAFGLAGCNQNSLDSQIDKCVQARVKADIEYYQEVEARNVAKFGPEWKAKAQEVESDPYAAFRPNGPERVRSKSSVESTARLACLQAASGKN
jgi:hypothetical protein